MDGRLQVRQLGRSLRRNEQLQWASMMMLTQMAGQLKADKSSHTMAKEDIRLFLQVGIKCSCQWPDQQWHAREWWLRQAILSPRQLYCTHLYLYGQLICPTPEERCTSTSMRKTK